MKFYIGDICGASNYSVKKRIIPLPMADSWRQESLEQSTCSRPKCEFQTHLLHLPKGLPWFGIFQSKLRQISFISSDLHLEGVEI